MKSFSEWCKHYGYDPETPEAKADYQRYQQELEILERLAFLDDDGPSGDVPHRVTLPHD
ncbi:TPA: hypothetical protein ACHG2K_004926 [Escherichia coli]